MVVSRWVLIMASPLAYATRATVAFTAYSPSRMATLPSRGLINDQYCQYLRHETVTAVSRWSYAGPYFQNTHSCLYLFGNLFGNKDQNDDQRNLQENELARFCQLSAPTPGSSSSSDSNVKFDSLSIMISEWSKLFIGDDEHDDSSKKNRNVMGLTTPVAVVTLPKPASSPAATKVPENDVYGEYVIDYTGVQLLFRKGKTGGRFAYQDKDEQKDKFDESKTKKDVPITEGGVEVRVELLSNGELRVVAKRCDIEEGTLIKEMSEQTILDSLRKAVTSWRKEQL